MDQDSFRRLLQTPRPSGSVKSSGGFLLGNAASTKPKTIDSSETAFKPRKLKKADSKYRDRAAERRVGEGNDYAHVEAIYEEFEKKTASSKNKDEVDVQRRYLGGDGEHSILVKGLDYSLLEQNKARAALSTADDDDALEEAFMEGTSHTPINVPKKRTREELLRDLKEQRARNAEQSPKTADEEARLLEEAKQKGKFKPIGFKPIGPTSEGKKKKEKRSVGDVERKNKKRKVEKLADKASSKDNSLMPPPPVPTKAQVKPKSPEAEEPIDEDFNIFADAAEYEGIDVGDDDDDDEVPRVTRETEEKDELSSSITPQRWIPSNETEPPRTKPSIPPLSDVLKQSPPSLHKVVSEDEAEDEQPMRLVPLSSSAVPSIKDLLAVDQAAGSYDKKKKRKNKKTGTGDDSDNDEGRKQKSVESKVDRDYKRLKSYTDKKSAADSK